IFCVHLQDNDGKGEDQHLIPGDGTVDWLAVIDALDRYAPASIRNFETGLEGRDVDELLATLAALRKEWTGR
ncbi:MAG TPA: sugar phosphate isomerase/epimerase, partial [Planctomycetota bacterium]|nr:sugar phosphate isomerase/epimerase [Planctomycetota bacterium]